MSNYNKSNFSPQELSAAYKNILSAQKITLLGHEYPDGDAMGSCAALEAALMPLGKTIEAIFPNEPQLAIPAAPKTTRYGSHSFIPDLIIVCDTANQERMYYPDAFKNIPLINIDHHISNSIKGSFNFIDGTPSSAAQVIYELLSIWDRSLITPQVADNLLYGILSDTQIFHIPMVDSQTLRAAADLIDLGADFNNIKQLLTTHRDPNILPLWGELLSNIKLSKNMEAASIVVKQSDLDRHHLMLSSLVGINNFIASLSQIDISALFYEIKPGVTKVSLRSKKADVNAIAQKFGGGGHKNASGIMINKPIDQVVAEVSAEF